MKFRVFFPLLLIFPFTTWACAENSQVKIHQTAPGSPQATMPAEKSDSAKTILGRLETAGEKYITLRADVDYRVDMPMTGDSEQRTGWVAFQKKTNETPDMFRITFEKLRLGNGRTTRNKLEYIFDGQWLIIAKHPIRSMTKIEIVKENDQVEPLKIGQGPFPIPFGQKAGDLLKYLEVSTREARASDPPNCDYLKFVPKPKFKKDMNFVRMEMWVDHGSNLPIKIVSKDQSKNITTVVFSKIKTESKIDPALFTLSKPAGWDLVIERKK